MVTIVHSVYYYGRYMNHPMLNAPEKAFCDHYNGRRML